MERNCRKERLPFRKKRTTATEAQREFLRILFAKKYARSRSEKNARRFGSRMESWSKRPPFSKTAERKSNRKG